MPTPQRILKVFKYDIPLDDEVSVDLPEGAQVLTFQAQREQPCIWALVDPVARLRPRRFRVAGTGHAILNARELRYVGTAQFRSGSLVFHLFEYVAAVIDLPVDTNTADRPALPARAS